MAKCTAIRAQANGKPGAVGWVLRRFWCVAAHHGVDAVLIAVGDPCSNTIPATGMVPKEDKVAARIINPEPVTPADPLEVNIKTARTIN